MTNVLDEKKIILPDFLPLFTKQYAVYICRINEMTKIAVWYYRKRKN